MVYKSLALGVILVLYMPLSVVVIDAFPVIDNKQCGNVPFSICLKKCMKICMEIRQAVDSDCQKACNMGCTQLQGKGSIFYRSKK